jgi:hypothetical protein
MTGKGSGTWSVREEVAGNGTAIWAVRMAIILSDPQIGLRIAIWKLNDKIITSGNTNG